MTVSRDTANDREPMAAPQARAPLAPEQAAPAAGLQPAAFGAAAGVLAAVQSKLPPWPTSPGYVPDGLDD